MQSLERARPIWPILAAVVLSFGLLVASGTARSQPQSNPTAQAVTEQQLFQDLNRIKGRVTIPDDKAAILQQPQGREIGRAPCRDRECQYVYTSVVAAN